ncbi:hypothetical protein M0805_006678 [Coniferiporia weirii]|nr:hypothetical protein M0805_006678 [Coniferiporia weirii]
MLPTHRQAAARRGGWRDMAVDGDHARLRGFSFLCFKSVRHISRIAFLLAVGALLCLWFIVTQLGPPPFLGPPFPRPPPPHGFDGPHFGFEEVDVPGPSNGKSLIDWSERAERVKEAFLHAYHGYEEYASPADELLPLSNSSIDNFNGWGVTVVDSLDTMYLMGLHDEFDRGIQIVEKMSFTKKKISVPFFETVIRYLGGLLSAYALSHDAALLKRADELGAALLPAFDTPSGLPAFSVNTVTGLHSVGGTGWLAEVGSCMMEYKYLAKLTGRKEYYVAADTVMRRMYDANVTRYPGGLLPTLWNLTSGQPLNDQISIGAMADSAFEYFLKQYLLTNQTETESLSLYLRTMRGILDHNLFLSPLRSLLYVTDISARRDTPSHKFEHLSCFLPGLFALGAAQLPATAFIPYSDYAEPGKTPSELERHTWAANGLAIACGTMYSDMPTGLGADEVSFLTVYDIDRLRLSRERVAEQERLREEAEKEAKKNLEKDILAERAPVAAGGPNRVAETKRPSIAPPGLNQTAADEKLRWATVLEAWREGRYDGETNVYVNISDKVEDEGTQEHRSHSIIDGVPKGPIPGLRDPPPEAPENSELRDYRGRNPSYQLRPETIESFFIMWRTTGDEVWRERGWAAFEGIEKYTRTASGYATIRNVFSGSPSQENSMPSFFLAETLKYLYLLFSDESLLPLDKYVLNTEAHPFPVFEWTDWEKTKFGITS